MKKPYGVWMRLADGQPWMYCQEPSLAEALLTARTLRGVDLPGSLPGVLKRYQVWIAAPAVARGHGRKRRPKHRTE